MIYLYLLGITRTIDNPPDVKQVWEPDLEKQLDDIVWKALGRSGDSYMPHCRNHILKSYNAGIVK